MGILSFSLYVSMADVVEVTVAVVVVVVAVELL